MSRGNVCCAYAGNRVHGVPLAAQYLSQYFAGGRLVLDQQDAFHEIGLPWAWLIRPGDLTLRVSGRLNTEQPQMANKIRVNRRHDPVVVRSAASVAHHDVPSVNPDTLINIRVILKLALA